MTDLREHHDLYGEFDPATMNDDVIYIGDRKYIAVSALPGCIKQLEWREIDGSFYAKGADFRVSSNGEKWAHHPQDFPPMGGYLFDSPEAAMDDANSIHRTQIMSAFGVTIGS